MTTTTNPYTVLNLRKGASEEEIKQAYFQLVKKWDPERHTEQFMVIQQAYEKLRDPRKRAKEDLFTYNYVKGDLNYTKEEREGPDLVELTARIRGLQNQSHEGGDGADEVREQLVQCLMARSYQFFKRRKWREAIQDLNQVLEIDPTNVRAKNNLNLAYMRLGWSYATNNLIKEAIELWEKSLQMNPDNLPIIHNLAIATEADGQTEKARRYWSEVLRRWKEILNDDATNEYIKNCIVEIHRHFGGRSLELHREGVSPIEEYREVLKIKPDDFEAQFKIAETLIEEHKWDEAIKELRSLISNHPNNLQVLNLYSWALINSGQVDLAFSNWQRCLQIDPKNYSIRESIIKARLELGKKFRDSGQFTQALVHFKALLKLLPKSPEVHYEIGRTYEKRGDKRSAAQHFNRALQIDPQNKEAKKALSDLRLRG